MTKKLPIVKFKKATDYDNSMFLLQRDADQSVVDGLDKQIAALQKEVERLKKERPLFTKNEVKHLLKCCQKDCANCDSPSSDSCKDIDRECMTFRLIGILGLLEAALSSKEEEK